MDTHDVDTPTRRRRLLTETVLLVGIALVMAVAVRALFVQAFYIPSASMEPGLVKNDRILVEKVSYWFGGSPRRGDVIVFANPGDWLDESGGHLVKRVIGVAGDTIVCCDAQGRISVDGRPLDEASYLAPQTTCNGPEIPSCHWTAGPVPPGHVFVLGDNRGDSRDSAAHLCAAVGASSCTPGDEYVSTDLVVGKVFARVWPLDRLALLHRPAT